MNRPLIERLVRFLPAESTYFDPLHHVFPGTRVPLDQRLQIALADPAFPWQYVRISAEIDNTEGIARCRAMARAFFHFRSSPDPSVESALRLACSGEDSIRPLLNALLLTDMPINEVAATLSLQQDTVELYEKLFFHVRDRRSDHPYILRLVYPDGRSAIFAPDYQPGPEQLLLRLAYESGAQGVLSFAGIPPSDTEGEMSARFRKRMAESAWFAGFSGTWNEDPKSLLEHAKTFLRPPEEQPPSSQDPFEAISMSDSVMETIRRMSRPSPEMYEAQRKIFDKPKSPDAEDSK